MSIFSLKKRKLRVALVPDKFAHYRYPVFKKLSDAKENDFVLDIYADSLPHGNIELASSDFCNLDYEKGGVRWQLIRDYVVRGVCVWQSKIVALGLLSDYEIIVYWGDAWRLSTWVSAISARIRGKKVVFWTHGLYGKESRLKLFVRLAFYKIANGMLLYGCHAKTLLVMHGFDSAKLWVINNSLDYDEQIRIYSSSSTIKRSGRFFDAQCKTLIFVGRLEPSKSLDMLIVALSALLKSNYNVGLVLVGDGSCRRELEELAIRLGVMSRVVFYGACYNQVEIASLIINCDVCVSPGNVGLTAMQSLVYGVPVVTHSNFAMQMPEFEAVVEGQSGALYEYGSQQSLNEAIVRCIGYLDSGSISARSCQAVIESGYTPSFQVGVFNEMLSGLDCIRT
ncbi:MAG: hypothetical protein CMK74_04170 [Pseudomonadales bacterium]|nr:hypothetical protein [Pseudomonadales bacterium]|tara:strand:+ start:1112 stop:2296 length:1185 start_codon:yes stop_codon:yes gene_type:complete